jgi:hypothetical protein
MIFLQTRLTWFAALGTLRPNGVRSISKNDRAHKKPVKAEFRSIPERFAQHCWDEGGEEHRRFMLAESSTTVPARPAQRQSAPGAFKGAILALFVNG